jgi:hypothetical protein
MIFIILFVILTTIVLLIGLLSMAAGGSFSKKFGTKLMSLRVIFQALAIFVLLVACFTAS